MTNINNTTPGDQYLTTEIINNINSSINLSLVNSNIQSNLEIPSAQSNLEIPLAQSNLEIPLAQSNLEIPSAQSIPNQLNLNETIQGENLNEKTGMNITTKTFLNPRYKSLGFFSCFFFVQRENTHMESINEKLN